MPDTAALETIRERIDRLNRELAGCETPQRARAVRSLIDGALDDYLKHVGAHSPDCRCPDCSKQLGRFRHLGECTHPDDVASEGW